jgi:hypothetical protein
VCEIYKTRKEFRLDDKQLLYYKEPIGDLFIVILKGLVETVLECYYEVPFTAHQGIARTIVAIKRKY